MGLVLLSQDELGVCWAGMVKRFFEVCRPAGQLVHLIGGLVGAFETSWAGGFHALVLAYGKLLGA